MLKDYKNAMNKISVDDDFEAQLKARLAREQIRKERGVSAPRDDRLFRRLTAVAAAAVLVITAVSAGIAIPEFLDRRSSSQMVTDQVAPPVNETVHTVSEDMVVFTGNSSVCLAQDLSLRYTTDDPIKYDTNIFFTFEGFEKYNVPITGSCIVFETALAPTYTLSNFFDDYYNLIINGTGMSTINNGIIESFFNIGDNGIRSFSVYDGKREIIDLDTALMSEYVGQRTIHFTIAVS